MATLLWAVAAVADFLRCIGQRFINAASYKRKIMAQAETPKISNDDGAPEVFVSVKEFECIGAEPPYDHPHVYLDMGSEDEIICPYCSTRFRFKKLA
jgi:uncharacterized Zn-finger protein